MTSPTLMTLGRTAAGMGTNSLPAEGWHHFALLRSYADPTQIRASGGAVGTGTATSAYLENIVPADALGDHNGVAPTWAKIFDGDTGSAPTWYGTQYAGNPS